MEQLPQTKKHMGQKAKSTIANTITKNLEIKSGENKINIELQ